MFDAVWAALPPPPLPDAGKRVEIQHINKTGEKIGPGGEINTNWLKKTNYLLKIMVIVSRETP
jgi:hypothetical protein